MVLEYADRICDGRMVSVLAGGYNPDTIGGLVVAHVAALASWPTPAD